MKKTIFKTTTMLIFVSLFTGCGGGGGGSTTTTPTTTIPTTNVITPPDITLTTGENTACTSATKFTVTPTDSPVVTFTTDAVSGDTSISIDSNSTGALLIQNCTTK